MPLPEEKINILRELGQEIRIKREELGISFNDVYQRTRIQPAYLDALENANYEVLPSAVYTLGFIRTYLEVLRFGELYPEFRHWLLKGTRTHGKEMVERNPYDSPAPGFKLASRFWIFVVLLLMIFGGVTYVAYSWSKNGIPLIVPRNEQRPEKVEQPIVSADASEDIKNGEASEDVNVVIPPPPEPKKELVITATLDDCWITVRAGNREVAGKTLKKGETFSMELTERARVNYGRASVATVIHNGKDLGLQANRQGNYYDPDGRSGILQQP